MNSGSAPSASVSTAAVAAKRSDPIDFLSDAFGSSTTSAPHAANGGLDFGGLTVSGASNGASSGGGLDMFGLIETKVTLR